MLHQRIVERLALVETGGKDLERDAPGSEGIVHRAAL
jgi:hypothetical protein